MHTGERCDHRKFSSYLKFLSSKYLPLLTAITNIIINTIMYRCETELRVQRVMSQCSSSKAGKPCHLAQEKLIKLNLLSNTVLTATSTEILLSNTYPGMFYLLSCARIDTVTIEWELNAMWWTYVHIPLSLILHLFSSPGITTGLQWHLHAYNSKYLYKYLLVHKRSKSFNGYTLYCRYTYILRWYSYIFSWLACIATNTVTIWFNRQLAIFGGNFDS